MKFNWDKFRNVMLIMVALTAIANTAYGVVIQGETSPGVYTNAAVNGSGVLAVSGAFTTTGTTTVTGTVAATQSGTWTVTSSGTNTVTGTVSVKGSTGLLTNGSGTMTNGGVAQTALAANATRQYLFIQNTSDTDMWFNFTTAAVATQPSIKLIPGASFVMEGSFISTEVVSVFGTTTGKAFTVKEK